MGTKLVRWAQKQRNLTAKQRYVLTGMCIIADDRHGKFYMNVHDFRSTLVPEITSHSSLRDHYAALCKDGYVGRIRKGNGRKTHTSYQILAIDVLPQKAFVEYERASARRGDRRPHPIQGRLRTFERIDGRQSQDVGDAVQDVGAESDIRTTQDVGAESDIRTTQDVGAESDIRTARMSGLNPTSHDKPKYYKANQTDRRAAPPSRFSDLELFCTAASEIEISGLLPEDLTGITDALEAYYALQRRQPLAEIARRVANEVKRTMPDDGRSDHKRVVGWFSGVATRALQRGGGVSVAGTTRNPGRLHSDVVAGGDQQDGWHEEYERAQKWHESRRGDVDGQLRKASGEG